MGETVTFIWPSHSQQLCNGILDLLKENFETDFKLLVKADDNSGERQMVKVHHVVLAIFCPLLKNVTEKELDLGNYTVEDLNRLVEFIYTGKTSVNKAGLSSLRSCANAIGLKPLLYSIESFVRRQKNADDDTQAANNTSSMSSQSTGTTAGDPRLKVKRPKKAQTTPVSPRKPATPIKSRAAKIRSRLRPSAKPPVKTTQRMATPPPSKITCQHCSYSADQNLKMISHMATVHHLDAEGNKLEKNVKCALCSFTCYTKPTLQTHRYRKHNKNQLKCEQCPYVCATRTHMKEHMKSHSDERPLMCEQCGARFKASGAYSRHMKRHQGGLIEAECEVCGKTVTLMSLKRHMELHKSDEKPNVCHLCSFATRKRYNLRFHLKSVHKVHMDRQGNVLGKDKTSGTSKSSVKSSSSADGGDWTVDLNSDSDLLPLFE